MDSEEALYGCGCGYGESGALTDVSTVFGRHRLASDCCVPELTERAQEPIRVGCGEATA